MSMWAWVALIASVLLGLGATIAAADRGEPSAPPVPDTVVTIGPSQGPGVTATPVGTVYTGPATPTGVVLTGYTYVSPSIPDDGDDDEENPVSPPAPAQSGGSLIFGAICFALGGLFLGGPPRRREPEQVAPVAFTTDREVT